jgi:hypothetical protein
LREAIEGNMIFAMGIRNELAAVEGNFTATEQAILKLKADMDDQLSYLRDFIGNPAYQSLMREAFDVEVDTPTSNVMSPQSGGKRCRPGTRCR